MPVWLKAALAQGAALSLALGLGLVGGRLDWVPGLWPLLVLEGALAGVFTWLLRLPNWWLPIQLLFLPAALGLLQLGLPSSVYLAAFLLLWLVFRSNFKERVPLYLSNATTRRALAGLIAEHRDLRFLDLGAGFGGVLAHLAGERPDGQFFGVESAPIPFAVAWLRLCRFPNARVRCRDLWQLELADFDVVYAFLSPAPMSRLWAKAKGEMRPGALLISNSFDIPDTPPHRVLSLDDARRTHLLLWTI